GARRGHVDPPEGRRLDRRRQESAMLDDRAAERLGESVGQHGPVALDDDVEIAPARRGAAPEIAHEPTDEIGPPVLLLGEPSDRAEHLTELARQAATD